MKKPLALLLLSPLAFSGDMILKCEGESCINETSSYIPTFKVNPFYPSKALNKELSGYIVTSFTILKNGSVKNVKVIESFCSTQKPEYGEFKELFECNVFNKSAIKATKKLTYPKQEYEVSDVIHRFTYVI